MLKKPKAKAEQCKKQDKHVLMQGKVKYYRQREPRNNYYYYYYYYFYVTTTV